MPTPPATKRVDVWVWRLIFVGIVLFALGLSVQRSDESLGWGIVAVSIALTVAGIVLIWVRSRMKDNPSGEIR